MTEKKKKELTDLQKKFLDIVMDDHHRGNLRKAMKTAGYADSVPTSYIIKSLSEELIELSKQTVAAHAIEATYATLDALENPASIGVANKLKAAQIILDRAGVKQEDKSSIDLKVPSGGLVILPAKEVKDIPTENDS